MRKVMMTVAAAFGFAAIAAPAAAVNVSGASGVSVKFAQNVTALGDHSNIFQSFDDLPVNSVLGTDTVVYNSDVADRGKKPIGTGNGNYASVLKGGSYTISLPSFSPVLSFLAGTIDAYNSVTLSFVDTANNNQVSQATYSGSEFGGIGQDGRVTFDTGSSSFLISAVNFASTDYSFELDSIASAAPEPGTWAMMILGFGLAGAGLRSRRRRGKLALA